jgi:hypothetical protein
MALGVGCRRIPWLETPVVRIIAVPMLTTVAWIQAAYFLLTGVWPVLSIRTFMRVTGPKTDLWLVKTVGVVVAVIGAAIGLAAARQAFTPEILALAIGSAAGLMLIDVIYVAKGVIARIYLADAVAQVVLIAGWLIGWGMR